MCHDREYKRLSCPTWRTIRADHLRGKVVHRFAILENSIITGQIWSRIKHIPLRRTGQDSHGKTQWQRTLVSCILLSLHQGYYHPQWSIYNVTSNESIITLIGEAFIRLKIPLDPKESSCILFNYLTKPKTKRPCPRCLIPNIRMVWWIKSARTHSSRSISG